MQKVLTFGVFDLLHLGHIKLFERAKQLGDYLIVAIQADESVSKYKPCISCYYPQEMRCYMVESIKYVDEIRIYKDVDKDIRKIDFDIFAVGEDQNHQGFQEAIKWCNEHGKEVVTLTRTKGISSSILRHADM